MSFVVTEKEVIEMYKPILLNIPAKSFLAGEYLALQGMGALVFCSQPGFAFEIQKKSQTENPFHAESPAGRLWLREKKWIVNYKFIFLAGADLKGWGTSTAEFIAVHALLQMKDSLWVEEQRFFDLHWMLRDYQEIARDKSAIFPPSGADLVAQVNGGLTLFERQSGKIQKFAWPFHDISFVLLPTGRKLKTHEHLSALGQMSVDNLKHIFEMLKLSLQTVNQQLFVQSIQEYGAELKQLNLLSKNSELDLDSYTQDYILAKKGCGAMGEDVLLLVIKKQAEFHFKNQVGSWSMGEGLTVKPLQWQAEGIHNA